MPFNILILYYALANYSNVPRFTLYYYTCKRCLKEAKD